MGICEKKNLCLEPESVPRNREYKHVVNLEIF